MNRIGFSVGLAVLLLFAATGVSQADPINWTDWTSGVVGTPGSGTGTLTVGGSPITVNYSGEVRSIQTAGGTNWWTEGTPAPYTGNPVIDNAPPASDIITVRGSGYTNTITFSSPVTDPVMALLSVGQNGLPVDYAFDAPFALLSEGAGWWGDGSWSQSGNTLTGREAHGAIQFLGTFTSISWVNNPGENWHGFTFGAPDPAPVPEPSLTLLAGLGLVGLVGYGRRRKRSA